MLEQLLAQQLGDNPQLQAMISMMQQNRETDTIEPERPSGADQPDDRHKLLLKKATAKIKQLRRVIEGLKEELDDLYDFNEDMALALGACPSCWGEDPDCPDCRGKGAPGSFTPDEELFSELVQPAVRRRSSKPNADN